MLSITREQIDEVICMACSWIESTYHLDDFIGRICIMLSLLCHILKLIIPPPNITHNEYSYLHRYFLQTVDVDSNIRYMLYSCAIDKC